MTVCVIARSPQGDEAIDGSRQTRRCERSEATVPRGPRTDIGCARTRPDQLDRCRPADNNLSLSGSGRACADHVAQLRGELRAYFAGTLTAFTTPLVTTGTPFEERVWAALRTVPYGATTSYGEVARAIGESTLAARAVGRANGRNRIAIVIPCHRVIGKNDTLVGYGGGLWRKQRLLELESRQRRLV